MQNQKGSPAMQSPTLGTVPNPDPTERTVEQLLREISTSREIVEATIRGNRDVIDTRLSGMDKAIELLQKTTDKIPDLIKDEVIQLKDLHAEKFTSVEARTKIQFDGIATQFMERDKRTEQLSLADKTAIAAALQAQKEAAGAQNESNAAANVKMETNFSKLIDQGQALLLEVRRNTEAQINDLKSRLDKGEGRSSIADPAIGDALREMLRDIKHLAASRDVAAGQKQGHSEIWGIIVGAVGLAVGLSIVAAKLIH